MATMIGVASLTTLALGNKITTTFVGNLGKKKNICVASCVLLCTRQKIEPKVSQVYFSLVFSTDLLKSMFVNISPLPSICQVRQIKLLMKQHDYYRSVLDLRC